MSCTDAALCSSSIVKKLESQLNCVLQGNDNVKTVNGSVSILHAHDHIITVEFYEKNEPPNDEHNISLKKLDIIPSEGYIKNII